MVHLDYVAAMLGSTAASNVIVRGFLDSPLWLDLPSINPSFPGFNTTTSGVFNIANVTHLDSDCVQTFPRGQEWKCKKHSTILYDWYKRWVKTDKVHSFFYIFRFNGTIPHAVLENAVFH